MKSSRPLIAASLLAASVGVTGPASPARDIYGPELGVFTTQERAIIAETSEAAGKRWPNQRDIRIILMDDGVTNGYQCAYGPDGEIYGTFSDAGPYYCAKTGAVVLGAQGLNVLLERFGHNNPAVEKALLEDIMGHEMGHHEQQAEQLAATGRQISNTESQQLEQQADCYAGGTVASFDPASITLVEAAIAGFSEHGQHDTTHGTPQQRISAFDRGASGAVC